MDGILWIIFSLMILIILVFAIAQYAKESKLQRICKRIANFFLLGIITLEDRDREILFDRD